MMLPTAGPLDMIDESVSEYSSDLSDTLEELAHDVDDGSCPPLIDELDFLKSISDELNIDSDRCKQH